MALRFVRVLVVASTVVVAGTGGLGCAARSRPVARQPPPEPGPPVSEPAPTPTPPPVPPAPVPRAPQPAGIVLRVETGPHGSGVVEAVDIDTYVRDVVVGELSVSSRDGALATSAYEAQAIVARTYALSVRGRHAADGFDVCSTTHCQVYARDQWRRSRWAAEIDAAVRRTSGRYLAVESGRPIEAVFHAHCGGHTSAAAEVWRGVGAAYLQGVDDPYCVREQPAPWSVTLDLEDVRTALNRQPRTAVGDRLDGVQVLRRDAGGRVVEVAVSGSRAPVMTGEDFRRAVMAAQGPRSIRSTRFEVTRTGHQLRFVGQGSGHGVGLCQIGLLGRLRAGQSVEAALLAYYPGARLVSPGT
ncbi:MAG: SpoIID/LytB domain-containing protein [Acidobacteria bacterium]|nr:SpoIID/LytB domain-containing protein [Acidobacteriota bacterium]